MPPPIRTLPHTAPFDFDTRVWLPAKDSFLQLIARSPVLLCTVTLPGEVTNQEPASLVSVQPIPATSWFSCKVCTVMGCKRSPAMEAQPVKAESTAISIIVFIL